MKRKEHQEYMLSVIISVAIMSILATLVVVISRNTKSSVVEETTTQEETIAELPETLNLWYYDSELETYMAQLAKEYQDKTGIIVNTVKSSYDNYLETINQANISDENKPDLFILGSEQLEKAYLGGLTQVNDNTEMVSEASYAKNAIAAVTYNEKMVAYPFCFDTCFMVYNTAYTKKAPATFDDIIDYADNFDGDKYKHVRSILEWDVKDIMYNYGFVGNYLECGGVNGDDESSFDVLNGNAKNSIKYYKKLAQYFSLDIDKIYYGKVASDFKKGNIVYALVKMDFIRYMGKSTTNYDVCSFPNLTDELKTSSLSNNTVICVSPFSDYSKDAKKLAEYMSVKDFKNIYKYSGKLAAVRHEYADDKLNKVYIAYEKSKSMPKLMSTADYRTLLQNAMNSLWQGAGINDTLKSLNNQIGKNISSK